MPGHKPVLATVCTSDVTIIEVACLTVTELVLVGLYFCLIIHHIPVWS